MKSRRNRGAIAAQSLRDSIVIAAQTPRKCHANAAQKLRKR
jgi:hypothetical protein